MNAVVIAIAVMFILSLARVSVVLTLVISAIIGGLVAGLSLSQTVEAFNAGLGDGAEVALAYAVLGAFALALSKSGLPDLLAHKLIDLLGMEASKNQEKSEISFINDFTHRCNFLSKSNPSSYCFYSCIGSAIVKSDESPQA